ncbi:MAG TPA: ABC transporter ATP-binding protein [Bacteroidia bacterium]|nr:ABC transporter ATP-binding protein [Bacteroidia bacterium]
MKLLLSYLKNYKWLLLLAMVLAAINQCFSMMDPYIAGKMIDKFGVHAAEIFKGNKGAWFNDIFKYVLALIGVAMVSRIAKNFQDYYTNVVIQSMGAKLYSDGIAHSLELPYEVFEDQRSGETLGKLQKVRADSEKFIVSFINIVFQTLVGLVFVVVYAINLNWMIVPVFLLTAPILAITSNFLSKGIKKVSKEILGETTALAGSTTESLRNIELVKSLGLQQQEINHLNTTTQKILKLELKKVRFIRSLNFIQGTTVNFLRSCFVFLLYYLIFKGEIQIGQMMTMTFYSFFIFGPLQELGNVIAIYREAEASLNNFKDIMSIPVEARPANPKPLGDLQSISFRNVTFKHQSASTPALTNVSFDIKLGETIAFVGPSGSGKTTLVKMLVGLYKPREGELQYNNKRGDEIELTELRSKIGFVTQDTQLFAGTIKENLLFVNPTATDAEVLDALNKAACGNLLKRADKGLDTMIGEGGVKVSGGEKQRLSIARALLRKPTLIIFDEATSALDSITEEEITHTIREVSTGKKHITVLIAHRLSTIMHADTIYVLERGKIIEQGAHSELLDEKGLYYAMWRQQIGEREYSF